MVKSVGGLIKPIALSVIGTTEDRVLRRMRRTVRAMPDDQLQRVSAENLPPLSLLTRAELKRRRAGRKTWVPVFGYARIK